MVTEIPLLAVSCVQGHREGLDTVTTLGEGLSLYLEPLVDVAV